MLTLKLAQTADGFAAGAPGQPRLLITGTQSQSYVHMQRALHDAVLIGSGTARADDPLLTVRLPGMESRKPLRIILDSRAGLSPSSRLAKSAAEVPTLLLASETAPAAAVAALQAQKIEVARLPCGADSQVELEGALRYLAGRGITRVFCEGGPQLGSALLLAGYADDVLLLTSGHALGSAGLPALSPAALARLSNSDVYSHSAPRPLGADQLIAYERTL
jgi:diaminohydroxyphosphoribosylaminopyrimidine deaminase/5-amino-6-(5-phosphoribosylamino)uracil reductase